ncbi:Ribbon-helix-helix protein, copG family [Geodermatophilus saharensis]|uniref:Ribbon-helix-helix protein, copG family n=1 Tax=Geodermatophilus saharensis TaxID=1137994 RepID=A0A239HGG1_9ACTN|nr:Ribbon-helix-helix protein, copG family [Geodermatophilus saharensis]
MTLDEDVAAAVERLRRAEGLGLSEAVNRLVRAGLVPRRDARPFRQRTADLDVLIDVTNVGEVLDLLDDAS